VVGLVAIRLTKVFLVKCLAIVRNLSYIPAVTTITVSSKYQIVIPREARERLHIAPGTRLQVMEVDGALRLLKEPTLEEVRAKLKGMKWKEADVRDEHDRKL